MPRNTATKLATGNSDATKAGKADTFLVTQESFDVAFGAGSAVGSAFHDAAEALRPLLYPLAARTEDHAVKQWNEYRRAFALGMADARNIDEDSARRMFLRITDYLGFDKPQTLRALEAQKKRQAAKAAAPADEAGEAGDDAKATGIDGAGDEAAQGVQMVLAPMEAHIISLMRQGKHVLAAQAIAGLAEQA